MTTEQLLEEFRQAAATQDSAKLVAIISQLKGRNIFAEVHWRHGRVTVSEGTITSFSRDLSEVFFDTAFGCVAGDAATMEAAESSLNDEV